MVCAQGRQDPDLPVLTVPDTAHDGGTSSLGALASAIEATRTAMTANLEIAARILTAAAANTIEADMVEEGYSDYTHLPNPGDLDGRVPTDDAGLYGDVFQYIEGPAAEDD